jgi:hypothetical protein
VANIDGDEEEVETSAEFYCVCSHASLRKDSWRTNCTRDIQDTKRKSSNWIHSNFTTSVDKQEEQELVTKGRGCGRGCGYRLGLAP